MIKRFFAIFLLASGFVVCGAGFECDFGKNLQVKLNGYTLFHYDPINSDGVEFKQDNGTVVRKSKTESVCNWKTGKSDVTRTVRTAPERVELTVEYSADTAKPVETFLHMSPILMDLPKGSFRTGAFTEPLVLETVAGKIQLDPAGSDGIWHFQDFRTANWCKSFRLHFVSNGAKGKAQLKITLLPGLSEAFTVFPQVRKFTRPRKDNKELTGWTGQGPNNDLSLMPSGTLYSAGVPLQVTESAVLLRSVPAPAFPMSSGKMALVKPEKISTFYFLQTAAWGAASNQVIANYEINYTDGTQAKIPVRYMVDVADWWGCMDIVNAKVAWTGSNPSGQPVCVYVMRAKNPKPEKEVASVELVSTNSRCILASLAVTGLKESYTTAGLDRYLDGVYKFRDGAAPPDTSKWLPCPIAWNGTIEPGSALDFSFMNHKPAGKFGYVKRVGDHFEFEKRPGEKIKFWGTNFAIGGPFPAKDLAPGIARTMAAQGVNMVRFHLYAAREELIQSADGGMDPEMLDRMFFLFSELKKNGIYIYMDVNDTLCYDWLLKRDRVTNPQERQKFFSIFDPELKESVRQFARILFTIENPYTKTTFANDPAVAVYELINEHSFLTSWVNWNDTFNHKGPFVRPEFLNKYRQELTALWKQWLKDKNLPDMPLPSNFNESALTRKFGVEMDVLYNQDLIKLLRELGVKVPICGVNLMFTNSNLAVAEQSGDFLGNHDYWAHPNFSVNPKLFPDAAALNKPAWSSPLINAGSLGATSLKGSPIIHGEWNYCYPNRYRCEGLPVAASIAAYQDWDGMIFYGATGSCDDGKWDRFRDNPAIMIHSQQTDPSTWGVTYAAAAMFRRDVRPSRVELPIVLANDARWEKTMPVQEMPYILEMGKVTIEFGDKPNWLAKLITNGDLAEKRFAEISKRINALENNSKQVISDTRQIIRMPDYPLFLVNTPGTQSVSGRLCDMQQAPHQMSDFRLNSAMEWATFSAVSIDGKPLWKSKRILITAVGNSANTDEKVEHGKLFSMGKAPVKTEPFTAEVTYRSDSRNVKVYVLESHTGKRIKELPVKVSNKGITFTLDGKNPTIYYEIVK